MATGPLPTLYALALARLDGDGVLSDDDDETRSEDDESLDISLTIRLTTTTTRPRRRHSRICIRYLPVEGTDRCLRPSM
jgi:hypothetical protein